MRELRPYMLGAAFVVCADRIFDVQVLTIPALIAVVACLVAGGVKFFHRGGLV